MALEKQDHDALLTLIAEFRERWKAHEESHEVLGKALELQHREYERRLDLLNHAHEQARETEATFVPRELFEISQKEQAVRDDRIIELTNANREMISTVAVSQASDARTRGRIQNLFFAVGALILTGLSVITVIVIAITQ